MCERHDACAVHAGSFQTKLGQIECISCDLLNETYYQDRAAQSSCLRCPQNTQRWLGVLSAANLSACQCSKDYWRHDGLLGRPCYPCPMGSVCPGKAALPFPQKQYWAMSEVQQNSTSRSLKILNPPGVDPPISALTSIFFQCNSERCKGGPEFECETGYTGPLCFECQPNRFYWMGTCKTACDEIEPRALVTIIGMMTVVFVWYIFYMMTSGSYGSFFFSLRRIGLTDACRSAAAYLPQSRFAPRTALRCTSHGAFTTACASVRACVSHVVRCMCVRALYVRSCVRACVRACVCVRARVCA